MRKLRIDAFWHKLTADQQAKIQTWLFDEHLSYRQTHARMRQEFGSVCALSGMSSIYHHCEELRSRRPAASLVELASLVNASGAGAAQLHDASKILIAARLLEKTMDGADVREICGIGRLLLKGEENAIRRARASLAISREMGGKMRRETPLVRDNPG